jgi:hypothetical protein
MCRRRDATLKIVLQGEWSTGTVYLDGGQVQLDDQVNGFAWGISGKPIRLAYAILVRMLNPSWATRNCEAFAREFLYRLPQTDFKVEINLGKWMDTVERSKKRRR